MHVQCTCFLDSSQTAAIVWERYVKARESVNRDEFSAGGRSHTALLEKVITVGISLGPSVFSV